MDLNIMDQQLTFWTVNLTMMIQMMKLNQSIQFHIGRNVSILCLNKNKNFNYFTYLLIKVSIIVVIFL